MLGNHSHIRAMRLLPFTAAAYEIAYVAGLGGSAAGPTESACRSRLAQGL